MMKTITFIVILIFSGGLHLAAQMPQTLNFQGILQDANGNALEEQSMSVTFLLYSQ